MDVSKGEFVPITITLNTKREADEFYFMFESRNGGRLDEHIDAGNIDEDETAYNMFQAFKRYHNPMKVEWGITEE